MDKQQERPLAYQAAQEIDTKELEQVSGGAVNYGFTTKQTINQFGGDVGADMIW